MRLSAGLEWSGQPPTALLDAHLSPTSPAPLALAFSGGGDSLALLLMAHAWTRDHGRRLIVLHVDHGLQATSAAWARHCQGIADDLGLPFQKLVWSGPKPETGLPAAARAARHGLLADAARAAGAKVILMGHTADDVLEAHQMRAEGATTPTPRLWGPSPAWPEGRGVFILRPLLSMRRAALRDLLARQPLTWIEDPANADLTYARARARARLVEAADIGAGTAENEACPGALALQARHSPGGAISWDRAVLQGGSPQARARLLSVACLCAAGGVRPPRRASVEQISARVAGTDDFTATLAGARIEVAGATVQILREAGEARRGRMAEAWLPAGQPIVWDGRFEFCAPTPGWRVAPLAGRLAQLDEADRQRLRSLSPAARRAWPALIDDQGRVRLEAHKLERESLVRERFEAAAGLVTREPDTA